MNSETPEATKAYIGNAARDGSMAVVFGQLLVRGRNHGVHVVLVPIRDDDGNDLPGVTTGDQGLKGGLLGVDNGTLRFERVRVPRADAAGPLRRRRRVRHLPCRDHQPEPPVLHDARDAGARPGLHRRRWRGSPPPALSIATRYGAEAAPVHRPRPSGRGDAARLPDPPAPAAAGDRRVLRARLRPERADHSPRPHPGRAGSTPNATSASSRPGPPG